MRTLGFLIEYNGHGFYGFQDQHDPQRPTVQGLLNELLSRVLHEPVTAIGAGRTDTGVHALGQVVHVQTRSDRALPIVARALVHGAQGRLGLRAAWEAPAWFHARHSASRRVYQYHVLCHPSPLPVVGQRCWQIPESLDPALLQSESRALLGRRDFRAFHSGGSHELRHFVRTVHRLEWFRAGQPVDEQGKLVADLRAGQPVKGQGAGQPFTGQDARGHGGVSYLLRALHDLEVWVMEIEADAFLPHMVRLMASTLIDVARKRRPPGTAAQTLRSRSAFGASSPAPPQGLCLVEVKYPAVCGVPKP